MKLLTKVGAALATIGTVGLLARENTTLSTKAYTVLCPRLPAAFDGLRIVHLSDLHNATFGKDQAALLSVIDSMDADMVLITGDLIDRHRTVNEQMLRPALVLLRELAKRVPTVRVDGNHEALAAIGTRFRALAEYTGVANITGRGIVVRKGDDRLVLVGIPDIAVTQHNKEAWLADMHTICSPYADDFVIALAHRPQYLKDYAAEGLPLVLSGHAHGGQVRLPFIGGLYAPQQGIFPTYTEGKHSENDTQMIVSRGLGNSDFPLRFGNRPEVVVITLQAQ